MISYRTVFVVLVLSLLAGGAFALTWDGTGGGTFEGTPGNTDPVSEGDDRIRDLKVEIRERAETDLCWGTAIGTGCPAADSGRLRLGSARAFWQGSPPASILLSDHLGSSALDDGRLYVDRNGLDDIGSNTDDNYPVAVRDETIDTEWETLGVLPPQAIILWDQGTGDENCDGTTTADECPCGFDEVTAFRGAIPRGADVAATITDIPDDAGIACPGGAGCNATASRYDDTLDEAEMPSHTHTIDVFNEGSSSTVFDGGGGAFAGSETSDATGDGEDHFHPMYTVLFCRYTGANL